jgi:UDP-N-acetylglucosamine 2-epimerase (non-hydrolysing)
VSERRRIAVFTSSRADLGPLGPVIAEMDETPGVETIVIATGTHLVAEFGGCLADIKVRNGRLRVLDVGMDATDPHALGGAFGRIAAGVSSVLAEESVDILVVLGDRWELLAAAGAALLHGVPIAHLHGGESTEGAIDERIRHGITKLSDLHLCATEESARRIRQLGEEPWRIVVTGAPGLDRVRRAEVLDEDAVGQLLGREVIRPLGVVVYHPATVDRQNIEGRAADLYRAASDMLGTVVIMYPGADPGAAHVIEAIKHSASRANVVACSTLGDSYLGLLRASDVLIGNSSSGIIEAASLGLPVIDIGDRQSGRQRPSNVLHVAEVGGDALTEALGRALDPEFRAQSAAVKNPYGDGSASPRIVRALLDAPLDQLARKPLVPVTEPDAALLSSMCVFDGATLRDAMAAIDRGRNQIALIVDEGNLLIGTISDGDVRRALLEGSDLDDSALPHASTVPVVAAPTESPADVLALMQRTGVTQVPVLDDAGRLIGLHVIRAFVTDVLDQSQRNGLRSQPQPWPS